MALTAREWLLLPESEQKERGHELSPHECFLLRTRYSYIHFTEEEKKNMTEEERQRFINPTPRELTPMDKKLSTMTIAEQIDYIFYSQEWKTDKEIVGERADESNDD